MKAIFKQRYVDIKTCRLPLCLTMLLLNPILTHLELRIIVSINQSATLMPGVACRAIHDRKQSISIHLVMPLLVPIFSVLHHHLLRLSSSAKSIFNFPLVASTSIYVPVTNLHLSMTMMYCMAGCQSQRASLSLGPLREGRIGADDSPACLLIIFS